MTAVNSWQIWQNMPVALDCFCAKVKVKISVNHYDH